MKRILVMLAVAAILLSYMPVLRSNAAEPILSLDFEDGNIASLGTATGEDGDDYYAAGNVSLVAGGANNSGYALLVSGGESGNGKYIHNLKPETEYKVTFQAKIANWGGTSYPHLGVNSYDGDKYVTSYNFTENWGNYSLTFKTGKDSTSALVYTWIYEMGVVDFFVDNIVVTEKSADESQSEATNDFANGSFEWNFENGDISSLGTQDSGDADGYYAAGKVSLIQDGANGTSYCLKISDGNSGNGQMVGGLKSNTEYIVSFYAKLGNWGGTSYPHLGVNSYDGDAYVTAHQFHEDWMHYTLTFKTGENSTSAVIYTWIYEEGPVDFYIDEVKLVEMSLYQPPEEYTPTNPSGGNSQTTQQENSSGEPIVFSTYTQNPLAKWFYPLLGIAVVELVAIAVLVYKIFLKKKK